MARSDKLDNGFNNGRERSAMSTHASADFDYSSYTPNDSLLSFHWAEAIHKALSAESHLPLIALVQLCARMTNKDKKAQQKELLNLRIKGNK